MKRRNKQFQEELIELRSLLKKYEYEVEMMSVQQHSETEQFIKHLHSAREKAGNIQRKYQEDERSYVLEGNRSASRLNRSRRQGSIAVTSPSLERERKTATLEKPIQELQSFLVSAENDRDIRKTRLGPASPSYPYSSRGDLHAPRDPYSYRERKYSPKGISFFIIFFHKNILTILENIPLEKPKTSRVSPRRIEKESVRGSPRRLTEKDTSTSMNKTVESIQQEY